MSSKFVISGDSPPCTHRNCWFISAARGRQSKASMHASYTRSEYLILPVMGGEKESAPSQTTSLGQRAGLTGGELLQGAKKNFLKRTLKNFSAGFPRPLLNCVPRPIEIVLTCVNIKDKKTKNKTEAFTGPEGTVKAGLDWKQMAFQRPTDPNRRVGLSINRKFNKKGRQKEKLQSQISH